MEARNETIKDVIAPLNFEVVITNYELILKERTALKKIKWHHVIIDEGHRVKNPKSKLSMCVRSFHSRHRILITGTPLQNNLTELWALMNFLLPDLFSSEADFDQWFNLKDAATPEIQEQMATKLQSLLSPFLLRRMKEDEARGLLPKTESHVFVGMSKMQKQLYLRILTKDQEAVNGEDRAARRVNGGGKLRLLNILMQLRKATNHPYLFDGVEPGPPFITGEHLINSSGKMMVLDKLLTRLKKDGSRVLIFSQMTRMLDIIDDYLTYRGHVHCRIDGDTSGEDRARQIEEFNSEGSEQFCFLLSTRAGGLGINLATADVVVLYDSDWNPSVDLQAMDRAHRIGQKKAVKVFRLVTEKSVEQKIVERAAMKLQLDAMIIQRGRLAEKYKSAGKDEIRNMIRFGAQALVNSTVVSNADPSSEEYKVTDEDIENILLHSSRKTTEMVRELAAKANDGKKLDLTAGQSSLYEFEGKNYQGVETKVDFSIVRDTQGGGGGRSGSGRRAALLAAAPVVTSVASKIGLRIPRDLTPSASAIYPPRYVALQEKARVAYVLAHIQNARKTIPGLTDDEFKAPIAGVKDEGQAVEALTEEEEKEKEALRAEGFPEWTSQSLKDFVKACSESGRDDVEAVVAALSNNGRPADEVRGYHKAFFTPGRLSHFRDQGRSLFTLIEAGERKLNQLKMATSQFRAIVARFDNPTETLELPYWGRPNDYFSEEEDRVLVVAVAQAGWGNFQDVQRLACNCWEMRFNWFFRSRSVGEIESRCHVLLGQVSRANAEFELAVSGKSTAPKGVLAKGKKADEALAAATARLNHYSPVVDAILAAKAVPVTELSNGAPAPAKRIPVA